MLRIVEKMLIYCYGTWISSSAGADQTISSMVKFSKNCKTGEKVWLFPGKKTQWIKNTLNMPLSAVNMPNFTQYSR